MAKWDPGVLLRDPHGHWGYVSTCWFTSTTASPFHHSHRTSSSFPPYCCQQKPLTERFSRRIPHPEFRSSKSLSGRCLASCLYLATETVRWVWIRTGNSIANASRKSPTLWVPGSAGALHFDPCPTVESGKIFWRGTCHSHRSAKMAECDTSARGVKIVWAAGDNPNPPTHGLLSHTPLVGERLISPVLAFACKGNKNQLRRRLLAM